MQHPQENRAEALSAGRRAETLIEALPWIKEATGKTVVIKYGGSAMVDDKLRADVMNDIVLMKIIGINPIIVHGGGSDITAMCESLGIQTEFKHGYRITPDSVMEIVKMVLLGKVNQELVSALNEHGHIGVGLSGSDARIVKATQMSPELGRVGVVSEIDTVLVEDLIAGDYIPVIASVAAADDGGSYNVNADLVAGELAAAIGAQKIIFLTDVDGLYEDFSDKDTLISRLSLSEASTLVENDDLSRGMVPKISACVTALSAGVMSAHILNGTFLHSMLLELLTDSGIGTMITRDDIDPDFVEFPVTNFASKIAAADESEA